MLLSGDKSLTPWLIQHIPHNKLGEIDDIYLKTQRQLDAPSAGYLINITRLNKADELISRVLKIKSTPEHKTADRLSMLTIHPVYGLFILTCVLFLLYQFVGNLGAQVMVEFLEDNLFGKIISPTTTSLIDRLGVFLFGNTGASGSFYGFYLFMKDILVGKYGIVTMALSYSLAIIFPIVGTFFLAFSIMEDTGYLPRLAVMSNRVFKIMGLHGKAVLPMVLGLGCDTMATLTARIMSTRKERILVTLLLALGVPCSAQLGVIMGMLGKLGVRAFLIWIFVVLGVIFLVGYIASKILPGEKSDFVLEIPPLRIPQLKNIVVKTFARLEWYLKEAVPLFILGTLFLFFMDKFQLMDHIERAIEPVVKGLLGLPKEAAGAFLLGFLRRDYGATIIFDMARQGTMDRVQILVSLITITLFIPCVANLFIIIKERGFRVALAMTLFIFPFAFFTGWIVNILLRI
jgi:ferrous iron transport protein B